MQQLVHGKLFDQIFYVKITNLETLIPRHLVMDGAAFAWLRSKFWTKMTNIAWFYFGYMHDAKITG